MRIERARETERSLVAAENGLTGSEEGCPSAPFAPSYVPEAESIGWRRRRIPQRVDDGTGKIKKYTV